MKNKPLMTKEKANELLRKHTNYDSIDSLHVDIFYGKEIHTEKIPYCDPTYWHYADETVEEKIEDNKQYKVWYTWRDAADPADQTIWYNVYYIEEIPAIKMAMKECLEDILRNII